MGRRKVEVRREEILVATVEEIEATGMATLRVADVAARLGVSTGLVFYHFATKDALLAAALEFAVARELDVLDANLASGQSVTDGLRRVIASYAPSGNAQGWPLWIDAWGMALRVPAIHQAMRTLDARWLAVMEAAVREGVARGEFSCADPAASIGRVGAALDGFAVAAVVYRRASPAQLRTWLRDALAAELGLDPSTLS